MRENTYSAHRMFDDSFPGVARPNPAIALRLILARRLWAPVCIQLVQFHFGLRVSTSRGRYQQDTPLVTAFCNAVSIEIKISEDHLSCRIAASYRCPQALHRFGGITYAL